MDSITDNRRADYLAKHPQVDECHVCGDRALPGHCANCRRPICRSHSERCEGHAGKLVCRDCSIPIGDDLFMCSGCLGDDSHAQPADGSEPEIERARR